MMRRGNHTIPSHSISLNNSNNQQDPKGTCGIYHMMCSKSQQAKAPASRTLSTITAAAAAATLMAAAAASSSSALHVPILSGVEAFAPPSPVLVNNRRLSLGDRRVSLCQRTNTISLFSAAAAEEDKDDDDGDAPASAAEDEVSRQLAKAKELIERTKQKMESKEKAAAAATAAIAETDEAEGTADVTSAEDDDDDDDDDEVVPFFAVDPTAAEKRRQMVTKTKDEASGLITTDGEKMASLADGEKWESRGLYDLFENEIEEDEAAKAKEARASRDVARSMMNLKMIMNKEDFDFIFDKKNRWIGEE